MTEKWRERESERESKNDLPLIGSWIITYAEGDLCGITKMDATRETITNLWAQRPNTGQNLPLYLTLQTRTLLGVHQRKKRVCLAFSVSIIEGKRSQQQRFDLSPWGWDKMLKPHERDNRKTRKPHTLPLEKIQHFHVIKRSHLDRLFLLKSSHRSLLPSSATHPTIVPVR